MDRKLQYSHVVINFTPAFSQSSEFSSEFLGGHPDNLHTRFSGTLEACTTELIILCEFMAADLIVDAQLKFYSKLSAFVCKLD